MKLAEMIRLPLQGVDGKPVRGASVEGEGMFAGAVQGGRP